MFGVFMFVWLVLCVVNVFQDAWLGVFFLTVWLSAFLKHVRAKASRRANVDRYYLLSTRWFGVFLHRIHHDDKPGIYHTHPWSWFSIVFGSYWDMRPASVDGGETAFLDICRARLVRGWNLCLAGLPHRVVLNKRPVWTLCFHGPRRVKWQVQDGAGRVLETEPWTGTEKPQRTEYA
jgi:hypothetical protein